MDAASSVRRSSKRTKVPDNRQVEETPMTDFAIHAVLRNLHLSPDTIETSTAAIYAHVRDPLAHPVDRDLSRLCTSDYTRGALHALSWYLVAAASGQAIEGVGLGGATNSTEGSGLVSAMRGSTGSSPVKSVQHRDATAVVLASDATNTNSRGGGRAKPRPGAGVEREGGGNTLTDSVTDRLATMFNRMRRTRSMPTKEQKVMIGDDNDDDDEDEDDEDDFNNTNVDDGRRPNQHSPIDRFPTRFPDGGEGGSGGAVDNSGASTPNASVGGGHSYARSSYLLASLGLGSPSASTLGGARATPPLPRRSPVKTGRWKLGHEIGKGSFGTVHIGLNEDSGDLIAVKVLPLKNVDMAESLYKEVELMRQLTHPNIVSYLGAEELLKDSIQVLRQKCDALIGEVEAFESGVDFDEAMP